MTEKTTRLLILEDFLLLFELRIEKIYHIRRRLCREKTYIIIKNLVKYKRIDVCIWRNRANKIPEVDLVS